jgi:hypothetical protein
MLVRQLRSQAMDELPRQKEDEPTTMERIIGTEAFKLLIEPTLV